ncbi:MAG: hypothetical protein R3A79_03865 [Nannocystaceae bacterium]
MPARSLGRSLRRGAAALTTATLAAVLAAALDPAEAAAFSCESFGDGSYYAPFDNVDVALPYDAQPWFSASCARTPSCGLYSDIAKTLPLDATVTLSGCDAASEGSRGVARLVPSGPLTPGAVYYSDCTSRYDGDGALYVRADDVPATPPPALDLLVVRRELSDGCCEDRWLSVRAQLDGDDAAFFREGGIVEITYSDGRTFIGADALVDDDRWELPDYNDSVVVTVVAADGERGEPVVLGKRDLEQDLAYVPCSIGQGGRGGLALWLLLPLIWIGASRRRGSDRC